MFVLERGQYKCVCDGCGQVAYTGQRSFQQAVNVTTREEGWEHRRMKDRTWRNYCPSCTEHGDVDAEIAGLHFFKKASSE